MKFLHASSMTLAAVAFAGAASAATVTFSTINLPKTGSDYSLIENTGTFLSAINFTRAAGITPPYSSTNPDPNVTLNGVTFTPQSGVGASGTYFTTNTTAVDTKRYSGVDYTTSPALYGLVYDVAIPNANTTNLTFNLQNLTIGQEYRVQFIFSSDTNEANKRKISIAAGTFTPAGTGYLATQGTGSDGTSDLLYYGTMYGPGLVTATFTADSTTEMFTMLANLGFDGEGNSRVSLAGFTLAAVPEPSACGALVALGLGGLVGHRRFAARNRASV